MSEISDILELNDELITKIVDHQIDYSKHIELRTEEIEIFLIPGLLSEKEKGYIQSIIKRWHINKSFNENILTELRSKIDNEKRYLALYTEKLLQENERACQENKCLESKVSDAEVKKQKVEEKS